MKNKTLVFIATVIVIMLTSGFVSSPKLSKSDNKKSTKTTKSVKSSRGMKLSKVREPIKIYYTDRAVVLTYHHISDKTYGDISIKPERFESDLNMLIDNGFNVISLRQLLDSMDGKAALPENSVVITFDDGIGSFYKYAYPLLKSYNLPATEFLITTRNESYKPSDSDTRPLSPAEITEMAGSGLIDFQSHTHNSHEMVYINSDLKKGPKLTNRIYDETTKTYETEAAYEKRVVDDLTKSSDLIYKYTGHYSDVLCFPFGIYNNQVIDLAESCGYKYFVTTLLGSNKIDTGKNKVLRIRAGDAKLNTAKLLQSIIDTGENKKPN